MNWAFENALSFDTRGRAWLRMTPRSAKRSATGLEVIAGPRSAGMVHCPSGMACLAQVSRMSRSARRLLSAWATIQPTA